jgi:hypothetical protein
MKKTLSIIFLSVLLTVQVFAQNQISELSKGLIFHWAGSEWFPAINLVDGTIGTATDTYNVLDRQGSGRRSLSFNGTSDYVTLPSIPAFGTGDFTVIMKVNAKNVARTNPIFYNNDVSCYLFITNTYRLNSYGTSTVSNIAIPTNQDVLIQYVRTSGVGTYYINGISAGTTTDTRNCTKIEYIGISSVFFSGSISMCRIFNNSTVDIAYYSKPENPIKAADLTACVLNLNAEGINRQNISTVSAGYWWDATNNITATVSGATVVIPPASNLGATWFNGTTSKLVFTGMNGLTGITTISVQIHPIALGGFILDNTKVKLKVNSSGYLSFSRDGSTYINSGAGSIAINTTYNILVASTAAGATNFYINNVLSGTANQAAGTPASGTTWNIGTDNTNFYSGSMKDLYINGELLDLDRIKLLNDIN